MPKIFGLHEIELPTDMTPDEFEQGFVKEFISSPDLEGWKTYLLKGDRGERAGKFLVLYEIESVEARDRYFPRPGEETDEARRFWEQHPDAAAALEKYGAYLHTDNVTDYLVVGSPSS
jgi:hypothetical protein